MREKAERVPYVLVSNAVIRVQLVLSDKKSLHTFPKHKSSEIVSSEIRKSELRLRPIEEVYDMNVFKYSTESSLEADSCSYHQEIICFT
jgi:hypothetical protein